MRERSSILVRYSSFVLLCTGRLGSVVASNILAVAVGWELYSLTEDPLDLGLVGLAQFLPIVLLTLLVGQVADRFDRRRIVAACRAIQGAAAVVLTVVALAGALEPISIFGVVALGGAARAFEDPTVTALMSGLVPREVLPRATVWYAMSGQVARISGPAIGGLLVFFGTSTAYIATAVLFVLAAGLTLVIRADPAARSSEPISVSSMFAGLAYVRRTPVVLGSISLDLFVVLFGGVPALLPIYARDILETGPTGLGLLRSAPAIGGLLMSVVMARYAIARRVGPLLFATVIVFGLATIVFGVSTNLALSLVALMILGAANVVSAVIRIALVQIRTPNEMRGRVSAVNSLFTGTSNQLGDFESGLTAWMFGTVPAVVLGGVGTVVVALSWMRLFPELRRADRFDA